MPPLFSECTAPLAIDLPTGLTAATPMQDVLALARTTFSSLQRTAAEDIVIVGRGTHCPWYGQVELQERAWELFYSRLDEVTVTFKQGMYPLASEDSTEVIDYIPSEREQLEREQDEKVNSQPDSE
jgi:hypothetical protein